MKNIVLSVLFLSFAICANAQTKLIHHKIIAHFNDSEDISAIKPSLVKVLPKEEDTKQVYHSTIIPSYFEGTTSSPGVYVSKRGHSLQPCCSDSSQRSRYNGAQTNTADLVGKFVCVYYCSNMQAPQHYVRMPNAKRMKSMPYTRTVDIVAALTGSYQQQLGADVHFFGCR